MSSRPNPVKQIWHAARRTAARAWLNGLHPRVTQIAITGSYGKTSTTFPVYHLLAEHRSAVVTDVNLDTLYNIPITALRLRNEQYIIFEAGIDHINEMSRHLEIMQPDISVITGISPVHADAEHLGSVENITREKRKLIEVLAPGKTAILHYDDPGVRPMATHTRAEVVWYGLAPECHYRAENVEVGPHGSAFRAVTPFGAFDVETPVLGRHNCVNLLVAIAIGLREGLSIEAIQSTLRRLTPLKGRTSVEDGPLGTILINDALRANTASVIAGLEYLADFPTGHKRVAVLGEMGEIGATEVEEHRRIGEKAASLNLSLLVCVGRLTHHTAEAAVQAGMPAERVIATGNVREVAEALRGVLQPGDVVYLKGSLMRHLERVRLILDDVEVGCTVISCPFYHQCSTCRYLKTGYTPPSHS